MAPPTIPERYKHHRLPAENLRHGVWLYDRLCLSDRDVEKLLCGGEDIFLRKLLTGVTSVSQIIIMDTLHSDGAANRKRLLGVAHRQHPVASARHPGAQARHNPHNEGDVT